MAAGVVPPPGIPTNTLGQPSGPAQLDTTGSIAVVPRVNIGGSLVFSGADAVANRGISASHSISGTSTTPNAGIYELSVTGDTATTPNYFNGLSLNYLSMGTGGGSRAGLGVQFSVTTPPSTSVGGANYVGLTDVGYASVNVGGTSTAYAGELTGNNPNVRLASGATYWGTLNGQETDAGLLAGSSAGTFYGQSIVHNSGSASNGIVDDAGLSFNDQDGVTARWLTGIAFGSHAAQWPIAPNGTIIGAIARTIGPLVAPVQALNGIDFRAVAFQSGGYAFASPGFGVDPAGNIAASSLNAPSLTATGSVTALTPGAGGLYAANVFPAVTIAPPASGATATAAVTHMAWSGGNTAGGTAFVSTGAGCSVNDVLTGAGATGTTFAMKVTSLGTGGSVAGYAPTNAGNITAPFAAGNVTMAGGTCTTAPVLAASFYVMAIGVTGGGSGYTVAPAVTIAAGPGNNTATATATTSSTQSLSAASGQVVLSAAGTALGLAGPAGNPVVAMAAAADQAYARIVATSGGSGSFAANVSEHFLDPAAAISAYTDTLPASPADGQVADISCGQAITTLTVNAAAGQTLRPSGTSVATSCSASQGHRWKYRAPQAAWNQLY